MVKRVNRAIGLLTMLIGLFVASWGPTVFQAVTGRSLPEPLAQDPSAMTVWTGVAFARAFGAALVVVGAFLWATNRPENKRNGMSIAPVMAAVFGALVIAAQRQAIWATSAGLVFVALSAVIAITSGVAFFRSLRVPH
jgi:hypothetical protein